jgi:hypothetical protein
MTSQLTHQLPTFVSSGYIFQVFILLLAFHGI